jgi:hypothetical protein
VKIVLFLTLVLLPRPIGGDIGQLISLLAGQMQLSADQQEQWESDGNGETISSGLFVIISNFLYFQTIIFDCNRSYIQ